MVAAVIILFAIRMDYAANGRGEAFHLADGFLAAGEAKSRAHSRRIWIGMTSWAIPRMYGHG